MELETMFLSAVSLTKQSKFKELKLKTAVLNSG
jgi:hypothetical protein